MNVRTAPLFIRVGLYFWAAFGFLSPIIAVLYQLIFKQNLHFFFIPFIAVFWLLAFYLFRLAVWNGRGMERIHITEDMVILEPLPKYIKAKKKRIDRSRLNVRIRENGKRSRLIFENEEKRVRSGVQKPMEELQGVLKEIKERLNE